VAASPSPPGARAATGEETGLRDFNGKVAVITGGASGIGLGLATVLAGRGAVVAIADVEQEALTRAAGQLASVAGRDKVLEVHTDVSKYESVESLRDQVLERFGRVDLLCNNAGVCTFNPVTEVALEDWEWVLGVNLWGPIHGVRAFLEAMLHQDSEGHIVNTASLAGVIRGSRIITPYSVAKHGVVALSEALREELRERDAKIGVTVLCPAHVRSNAWDADRNRPGGPEQRSTAGEAWRAAGAAVAKEGPNVLLPTEFANLVLQAVEENRFWVFTDPTMRPGLIDRFNEMLEAYPAS
jgi:NAD(P)-dependent dehydrogenase (short-subunit alcohol dehydrogenase family)